MCVCVCVLTTTLAAIRRTLWKRKQAADSFFLCPPDYILIIFISLISFRFFLYFVCSFRFEDQVSFWFLGLAKLCLQTKTEKDAGEWIDQIRASGMVAKV